MVIRLAYKDEVHPFIQRRLDQGLLGKKPVAVEDDSQLRVLLSDLGDHSFARIEFAVLLVAPVSIADLLGHERNDLLLIWVH